MEIQLHHSGWKSVQLGWNSNQTVKAAVFYFPYFAHDLFLWQLGDLLNNKNFDTSLAHSCTRFSLLSGYGNLSMQRPNVQQQRLLSWAIN